MSRGRIIGFGVTALLRNKSCFSDCILLSAFYFAYLRLCDPLRGPKTPDLLFMNSKLISTLKRREGQYIFVITSIEMLPGDFTLIIIHVLPFLFFEVVRPCPFTSSFLASSLASSVVIL